MQHLKNIYIQFQ